MLTVWPKLYSCKPVTPMADRIEALGIDLVGRLSSRARRTRSACVVALGKIIIRPRGIMHKERSEREGAPYPKGSPTTKKAISSLSALAKISSLEDSTISRSARMTWRP